MYVHCIGQQAPLTHAPLPLLSEDTEEDAELSSPMLGMVVSDNRD